MTRNTGYYIEAIYIVWQESINDGAIVEIYL